MGSETSNNGGEWALPSIPEVPEEIVIEEFPIDTYIEEVTNKLKQKVSDISEESSRTFSLEKSLKDIIYFLFPPDKVPLDVFIKENKNRLKALVFLGPLKEFRDLFRVLQEKIKEEGLHRFAGSKDPEEFLWKEFKRGIIEHFDRLFSEYDKETRKKLKNEIQMPLFTFLLNTIWVVFTDEKKRKERIMSFVLYNYLPKGIKKQSLERILLGIPSGKLMDEDDNLSLSLTVMAFYWYVHRKLDELENIAHDYFRFWGKSLLIRRIIEDLLKMREYIKKKIGVYNDLNALVTMFLKINTTKEMLSKSLQDYILDRVKRHSESIDMDEIKRIADDIYEEAKEYLFSGQPKKLEKLLKERIFEKGEIDSLGKSFVYISELHNKFLKVGRIFGKKSLQESLKMIYEKMGYLASLLLRGEGEMKILDRETLSIRGTLLTMMAYFVKMLSKGGSLYSLLDFAKKIKDIKENRTNILDNLRFKKLLLDIINNFEGYIPFWVDVRLVLDYDGFWEYIKKRDKATEFLGKYIPPRAEKKFIEVKATIPRAYFKELLSKDYVLEVKLEDTSYLSDILKDTESMLEKILKSISIFAEEVASKIYRDSKEEGYYLAKIIDEISDHYRVGLEVVDKVKRRVKEFIEDLGDAIIVFEDNYGNKRSMKVTGDPGSFSNFVNEVWTMFNNELKAREESKVETESAIL